MEDKDRQKGTPGEQHTLIQPKREVDLRAGRGGWSADPEDRDLLFSKHPSQEILGSLSHLDK